MSQDHDDDQQHGSLESSGADASGERWYDLFSRGARDWLRHNRKVRDAVKAALPDLIAGSDVLTRGGNRSVQVPVRFLEHYRFRLRDAESHRGAGQGEVHPGDVLRRAKAPGGRKSGGGNQEGEVQFVLELSIDDILDWLWEELELPNLQPKPGRTVEADELVRAGWDRHGPRARLDRRRTLREAVKRRVVQADGPPFANEDLRFRQLARRRQPTTSAVVMFLLDVSSSMDEQSRILAKTFFFWALEGVRRQYARIEAVFIGHTVGAWEFEEQAFFQVKGEGGTVASSAFALARDILHERFDPGRYNAYLFYASDGENFVEDRSAASALLRELAEACNFVGYVEVNAGREGGGLDTETGRLFSGLAGTGASAASYVLYQQEDVWQAIRAFFRDQAQSQVA
jgi:sporulation protein YhbH